MDKKRIPLNGTFELTGRCNLSCKMCLVRVDCNKIKELGFRERTTEEWIQIAEQARDAGTLTLLLTGGEVMLRPDFCEIYEAIAQMGFLLTVYTNATMVTDKIMELFRKYPPHKIGVTMYGASNETYEKMCGCSDGYDRFVEGIAKLSTLPSALDIRTTIIQDNLEDLQAMKDFTEREFNQMLTISRFVTKSIRGGIACAEKSRLTPEQNVALTQTWLMRFFQQAQNGEIDITEDNKKLKMERYPFSREGYYLFENCGAGINQYVITWNGHMYACELLDKGYTLPFSDGFAKAWEELPEQYPLGKDVERCDKCKYAALCESCPAQRLAETGEWFGIPEYACDEARYLYKKLEELKII